jgi:hypothetical protein
MGVTPTLVDEYSSSQFHVARFNQTILAGSMSEGCSAREEMMKDSLIAQYIK